MVDFVRENPFARVWAEGDERDRRNAATDQQMRASEQQIRASEAAMRDREAERARTRTVNQAAGDAAVAMANPLERVTAREVPDWNAAINLPETPPMATETTRETVRRALPSQAAIATLAKGGAGTEALRLATGEAAKVESADDKFFEMLGKAATPGDLDITVEWGRRNGINLPDQVVQNKRVMAELQSIAKTASQFKIPREKSAELMRAALEKAGMGSIADAIPYGQDENDAPHGQPFNLTAGGMGYLTKDGRLVKIDETIAPKAGGAGGGGQSTAMIRNAEWMVKNGIAANPNDAFNQLNAAKGSPERRAALLIRLRNMKDPRDIMGTTPLYKTDAEANAALNNMLAMTGPAPAAPQLPIAAPPATANGSTVVGPSAMTGDTMASIRRDMAANGDTEARVNLESTSQPGVRVQGNVSAAPSAAPPAPRPASTALPPQAAAKLREGVTTRFANGQKWTLKNGQPVQVQ
jgi:hypothetical protein